MSAAARYRAAAALILGLLLAGPACTDAGRAARRADDDGRTPARIVSLIPSATETILALGAGDRLVARTDYDEDAALAGLPSLGRGLTPSLERLAMLRPQLVVAWPDNSSRSLTSRLAELGIAVYAPEIQTLADIRRTTRRLGQLLGLESAADSLVAAIDGELASLRRALAGRARPTVFYVVWHEPPTTAGRGTYLNELIEIAGGRNLFADAPGRWPQVSLEEVVRRQPDIVVLPQSEERALPVERLRAATGWRELRALREGRVFTVDALLYNRPGPRVAEAARRLALLLHPEAFAGQAR